MDNERISSSKQKKIDRKLNKLQFIVKKETAVDCSEHPTKILAICNAGLVNGLSEELLFEYFSKHGTITNIKLLLGKSCCFVSYYNVEESIKAYNAFNGKLNIAQDNKPIYLLYAQNLPDSGELKIWKDHPPGLILLDEFVTVDEERRLLQLCNFEGELIGKMKNRLVKHFGFEFRYGINNVEKDKPLNESMPTECDFIWKKLSDDRPELKNFKPDQLTINHYSPGQGIPSHVDTHSAFHDPIICLSLGSAIVMEFKKNPKHVCVLLPQRSLLIMSGESRYAWTHGIVPRKFDVIRNHSNMGYSSLTRETRVSFTFRKILHGECKCSYKEKCDSYNKSINIEDSIASKLEQEHVRQVYENIANHFSETRHKPWPNVLEFVQSFELGSILVDVGCGNGKYLGNKHAYEIGFDFSSGLIDICKSRGFEVGVCDCLKIPLNDNTADGVLSIAVIHHLANKMRRKEAVKEIARILKVGGKALIYVWAHEQIKDDEKSSYIKQDRKNRKTSNLPSHNQISNIEMVSTLNGSLSFPVHTNRSQFQAQDVLVPWKLKDENKTTFLRFYHVFEEHELENLCREIENVKIVHSYYDQGNFCIVLEKTH